MQITFFLYVLALLFLLVLSVPFHELGHYLAIKIFRGQINFVELTSGKPILKYKYFTIGLKLYTGQVNWDEKSIKSNKKRALVSLAGPLMDFLLSIATFVMSISLYSIKVYSLSLFAFFTCLSVLYLLSGMIDLIPNKRQKNDGYNFYRRMFTEES